MYLAALYLKSAAPVPYSAGERFMKVIVRDMLRRKVTVLCPIFHLPACC
jgi:hypothetical protein